MNLGIGSTFGLEFHRQREKDITTVNGLPSHVLLVHFIVVLAPVTALLAILCADLSMLSKAETERIWLPFTVWLTAAAALLPPRSHRWWLGLNVIGALAINHLILTNW